MLNKLVAFVLLLAVSAQSFSRYLIIADYYTNTAAYAKNCVNKARPKLRCHGKCQMMKKLQQEEKKEQENSQSNTNTKADFLLSSKSFFAVVQMPSCFQIISLQFYNYTAGHSIDRSFAIFHPPKELIS